MNRLSPEIAVIWEPRHPQSGVFFDVPIGEKRSAKLSVHPRVGPRNKVNVVEPKELWMKIEHLQPAIRNPASRFEYLEIEPLTLPGRFPPFEIAVRIDTTSLREGTQYDCHIQFKVGDTFILTQPVVLTTKVSNNYFA